MRLAWDDVDARARGLSGRLLSAARLRELAAAPDLVSLGRALTEVGYGSHGAGASAVLPGAVETAVRRAAASRIAILDRWLGPRRREALAAALEGEDRRSLRVLLRRAWSAAPGSPVQPVAAAAGRPTGLPSGLVATPSLPEPVLEALARAGGPGQLIRDLCQHGHPLAPALERAAADPGSTLLDLDLAASRAWAEHALAAGRGGGADLVHFVRAAIDGENAAAALVLRDQGAGLDPEGSFLAGGERLGLAGFVEAAGAATPDAAREVLERLLEGGPVGVALRRHGAEGVPFERALTAALTADLRARALRRPLGAAPVLVYLLRLRAEVEALGRIVWGVALGEPASRRLATGLVG